MKHKLAAYTQYIFIILDHILAGIAKRLKQTCNLINKLLGGKHELSL